MTSQGAVQEFDESRDGKIVPARAGQDLTVGGEDEVVGLGVHFKTRTGDVGVYAAQGLERLAGRRCKPFAFRKFLLVIGIQGDDFEVVAQPAENLRINVK